jgi:lysophospholipase L1-like esterase
VSGGRSPTGAPGPQPSSTARAWAARVALAPVLLLLGTAAWHCAATLHLMLTHWSASGRVLAAWRWPVLVLLAAGGAAGLVATAVLLRHRGAVSLRIAPLTRATLYGAVTAWLWIPWVVSPYRDEAGRSWCSLTLAGFALAATWQLLGRRPRRWLPLVRVADLLLLNLAALVVAGELTLRTLATLRPSVLLARPAGDVEERIARSRYQPGTVRHGFPVNHSGHYDENIVPRRPGRRLVVAIGDSFSYGVVPHPLHFTTVAEASLPGVDVYNLGLPAIGPPEYLHLAINEALPLAPDLVVVNLFLGNDLTDPPLPTWAAAQAWRWLDRGNVLVVQVPRRALRIAAAGSGVVARLDERNDDGADRPRTPQELRRQFPWVDDPALEPPSFGPAAFLSIESGRYQELARLSPADLSRNLAPLAELLTRAAPAPVAVLLIPDQFQVDEALWERIKPPGASDGEQLRSLAMARAWLEERSVPYLDLRPVLLAVPPLADGDRHLYHLRDTHFNARGNRAAGEALAAFIEDQLDRGAHPAAAAP